MEEISAIIHKRIDSLERTFQSRFDRMETKLDKWSDKNDVQNVQIQQNTQNIALINKTLANGEKRKEMTSKKLVLIVAVVSVIVGAISNLDKIIMLLK